MFDGRRALFHTTRMIEKDTHIVARPAGIPLAGCREADRTN